MTKEEAQKINEEFIADMMSDLLIDGVFKELVSLETELKPKVKRLSELRDWCKGLGTYATENYVCSVRDQERRCLVSLDKAADALGQSFLIEHDLIQVVSFQVVSVSPKINL